MTFVFNIPVKFFQQKINIWLDFLKILSMFKLNNTYKYFKIQRLIMKMDLSRIKTFYTVASSKSFLKAASELNITQPCLSRSVKLLEEELGIVLFERHSKGVRLTPQGLRTFEWASKMLKEASIFEKYIKDHVDEPIGELRIATLPSSSTYVSNYLLDFIELYPKLRINIIGSIDKINLNEADVIISSSIPQYCQTEHLFLKEYHMKLYASEKYVRMYGVPESLDELKHHRLIKYGDQRMRQIADIDFICDGGTHPWKNRTATVEISPADAMVQAAEAGLGIVELADYYANLRGPKLIEIPIVTEYPKFELLYIYRKEATHSKRVTAFGYYLKEKLSKKT